ncbi:MAG: substrate-binding domain-containing protein [Planctomycetes bacterium]|nr:substrate-binding domain-containing protein [Planctomycetota bacterium]
MSIETKDCPALVLNADFRPLSYFPLSLWSWHDAVKAVVTDRVNVVSSYDRYVRSPSFALLAPSVISLKEFIVPNRRPAFTRFNVFLRDRFACQYCGDALPSHELTFDHVVPRSRGGRIVRDVMQELGSWQEFESLATVFKPTMPELANDLKLGTLDAAILWDATVAQHEELAAIVLPEFAEHSFLEAVGVLKNTEQPALALQFARYMQAQDRGALTITRNGFRAVGGDRWQAVPKLTLFAGAMLNRAVDQAIHEFSAREGVQITRVYNGCGILVGQMRAGAQPDAYFSCDQSFLDQVADRFQSGVTVSQNPIMLITAKANPHQIHRLDDLLKPGLRVGLAHPEKSALGFLTRRLLQQLNLEQRLIDSGNIKQETPQGDLLVSAMATGALDAIVVYKSNAMGQSQRLRMLPIDSDLALARQPFAVALDSKYPHTMQRLFDALTSAATQQRFEELGFVWLK